MNELIRYLNTDQFYRFVKRWERFKVGDIVTTDFHQNRKTDRRKITAITQWECVSQSGVKIETTAIDGASEVLAIDSEWYKEFNPIDDTASLDDFLI